MATNLAAGRPRSPGRCRRSGSTPRSTTCSSEDPFSGHVVIRSTDAATPGSNYRLWTTLKVPQGFSLEKHCEFLARRSAPSAFRLMPAKRLFALGVGHVRRRGMEPGSKSDELAEVHDTHDRRADGARVARAHRAQARVRAGRDRARRLWAPRAAGGRRRARRVLSRRRVVAGPRRDRALLDVPRARQAARGRRARHALQRALPLGRAAGPRDRSGARSRPAPHHDPRLLARGRAGVRQRQHHGRRARHGQGARPRAQGRDRRAPARGRHRRRATPTSSGAGAARSSRRRSRRSRTPRDVPRPAVRPGKRW